MLLLQRHVRLCLVDTTARVKLSTTSSARLTQCRLVLPQKPRFRQAKPSTGSCDRGCATTRNRAADFADVLVARPQRPDRLPRQLSTDGLGTTLLPLLTALLTSVASREINRSGIL